MQNQNSSPELVYKDYTLDQLREALDVEKTINDLPAYQQKNLDMSIVTRKRLKCFLDVPYDYLENQKLDIFPSPSESSSVLIDIHGGGWRAGSKNARSYPAENLVNRGITWVPIDYGLAPQFNLQEIVHHVRTAVSWVFYNISKYGGNPDRIFISGNSAGGHLTGCALMPNWHHEYQVPADIIKGACAISGIFDMQALIHANDLFNQDLKLDTELALQFSPQFHLPQTGCPLIISHGTEETSEFYRQSDCYFEAWENSGFPAKKIVIEGAHHFAMSRELASPDSYLANSVIDMLSNNE